MIEIIREEDYADTREGGLPKDITQMGKPDVGDRIYVEDRVYRALHPYAGGEEKAAYVLLGKFENYAGRQCTFIEGVIRLEEISFDGELPLWNDSTWGYLYKKLKNDFDDMSIVGWAMDIKGQLPNLTGKIEKLHQTHFGGIHQVLFLMDTLEREEAFYSSRNGRLYRRDGFYIYYGKGIPAAAGEMEEEVLQEGQSDNKIEEYEREIQENRQKELKLQEQIYREESEREREEHKEEELVQHPRRMASREGTYRKRNTKQDKQEEQERASVLSSPFILAMVVCVLVFTAFRNHQKMNDMQNALAQINTTSVVLEEETQKPTMADEVKVEQVEGKVEKQQNASETQEMTATAQQPEQQEAAAAGEETQNIIPQETAETQQEANTEAQMTENQITDTSQSTNNLVSDMQQTIGEVPSAAAPSNADIAETTTEEGTASESTAAETTVNEYLKQGYYIVQKGDSVAGICRKIYQTTAMMDELCKVNGIDDPNAIYAGQYLTLPN